MNRTEENSENNSTPDLSTNEVPAEKDKETGSGKVGAGSVKSLSAEEKNQFSGPGTNDVLRNRKTTGRKMRKGRVRSGKKSYSTPQVLGISKYEQAISEADELFEAKDFEAARKKYEAALDIKPADAHATKRINEIKTMATAVPE